MSRRDIEKNITAFWEKNNIFQRSVQERPKDKEYVFYDGPPFATGLPHQGHILGLTSKDVFPRYWTMKGYRVERRWGWDCHGLPIENIAEKELKIKKKNQIEEMGVDKFNEFCRSKVLFFADEWKKTVTTMGKWIEFDNSYKTMDQTYMESVWWAFGKLFDEGYIYEGKKVLMYCPRCQTPLANSEIQMDNSYKDVTEKTATVAFKVKGKDEYLVAWTTTPWTLIGNVALAINPTLEYAKIDVFGKKFILAKELVEKNFKQFELLETFKGKKLLGTEYEPLYEMPVGKKKGFYVIDGTSGVTAEEGTGIVHMALYGEFDYQMIRKYDLPIIQHIAKDGTLALGPTAWIGKWFKDVDADVLEDLYARGQLIEAKPFTHSYPFCYRCETPLIYNAVDSWFVDIQKIKPTLLKKAETINWYPENIKEGRFKYILETAPDWSISRNRFWATAIPVWKCASCGKQKVIGSIAQLQKNAVEKVPASVDLHKHIVDKIHLKCECGKAMDRIPEVLDCWFESGSMPFAAKHYPFENKEWLTNNYPADFISEYIAQVRAWFYYMHVMGVLLMGKAPFKHVVVSGNVLAADGAKMSKSKGNYTDPNKLFEAYGADALRFYLMSSQLMRAQDLNFLDDNVKEVHKKLLMIVANVKNFYELFGAGNTEFDDTSSKNILDKWMVSNTEKLVLDSTKNYDEYNTPLVCRDVLEYVDELSTWFVRRSRDRFKSNNAKEKKEAVHTLAYALDRLARVLAPITPFLAEELYHALRASKLEKPISVHLEAWPKANKKLIDAELHDEMKAVREVVSQALEVRNKNNVPVRQPLASVTISGKKIDKKFFDIIMDELNVKEVLLKPAAKATKADIAAVPVLVELDLVLTKELLLEGASRELMRKLNDYRKEIGLTIKDTIVLSVDLQGSSKEVFEKFGNEIKKSAQIREIVFGPISDATAKEIVLHKENIKVLIKK